MAFNGAGGLPGDGQLALDAPARLPPAAPPSASAFMNPPLLVVARPDRMLPSNGFAQQVAAEPQPIRLPPPILSRKPRPGAEPDQWPTPRARASLSCPARTRPRERWA